MERNLGALSLDEIGHLWKSMLPKDAIPYNGRVVDFNKIDEKKHILVFSEIFIEFPWDQSDYDLYDALNQFGRVFFITKKDHHRFNVQIVTTKPIDELVPSKEITVNDIVVDISKITYLKHSTFHKYFDFTRPACDKNGIVASLQQAPDQGSKEHILNAVCDDILTKIFEMLYTNRRKDARQLFTLATVCKRFHRVASDIFARKNKGLAHIAEDFPDCKPIWMIEEYLKTFGSVIKTIDLGGKILYDSLFFELVVKYCRNVIIIVGQFDIGEKSLILCVCPKSDDWQTSYESVSKHLADWFSAHKSSHLLTLAGCVQPSVVEMISSVVPELKTLSLDMKWEWCRKLDVSLFRKLHNLNHLNLNNMHMEDVVRILNAINDGCAELQHLELKTCSENATDLSCFGRLIKLEVLNLKWVTDQEQILVKMVNGGVPLQKLRVKLFNHDSVDRIKKLARRMKSLRWLFVTGNRFGSKNVCFNSTDGFKLYSNGI